MTAGRDGVSTRMKVAFLSGTSIVNSQLFASWSVKTTDTPYGKVTFKEKGDLKSVVDQIIRETAEGVVAPAVAK